MVLLILGVVKVINDDGCVKLFCVGAFNLCAGPGKSLRNS